MVDAVAREGDDACGVVFRVREGKVVGKQHYYMAGVEAKEESEIVAYFLRRYYLDAEDIPSEILVQKRDRDTIAQILRDRYTGIYTKLEDWIFNADYGYELLINHFKTQTLKGFGIEEMTIGLVAACAVMHYMQETQKENVLHVKKIVPHSFGEFINLDQSTRRHLEITASLGDRGDPAAGGSATKAIRIRSACNVPPGGWT